MIMAAACPICGKPCSEKYRPFCGKRCADVDLNRWFSGRYVIPTEEKPIDAPTTPDDEE